MATNTDSKAVQAIEDKPATLCLQGYHLPELKDLHVDDVISLTITAKVTRKEEGGYGYMGEDDYVDPTLTPAQQKAQAARKEAQKKKVSANFTIQSIKSNGPVEAENAAEDTGENEGTESPEVTKANKFNKLRKQGKSVSEARTLAGM